MTRFDDADCNVDAASVRKFVLSASMDHLGNAQLEFQESLFALHQEIDHYKVENGVSSDNANCPLLLSSVSPKPKKKPVTAVSIDLTMDDDEWMNAQWQKSGEKMTLYKRSGQIGYKITVLPAIYRISKPVKRVIAFMKRRGCDRNISEEMNWMQRDIDSTVLWLFWNPSLDRNRIIVCPLFVCSFVASKLVPLPRLESEHCFAKLCKANLFKERLQTTTIWIALVLWTV